MNRERGLKKSLNLATVLPGTCHLCPARAWRGHRERNPSTHLSPIGWEHVNLTCDYTRQAAGRIRGGSLIQPTSTLCSLKRVIRIP